ncbi:MAG TPA: hypothetical protein VGD17_16240 [Chitinophagaceae bacterium]
MADKKHDQPMSKPDPETLHTTDPQEHMKGPISSVMHNIQENAEENDTTKKVKKDESKEEEREED